MATLSEIPKFQGLRMLTDLEKKEIWGGEPGDVPTHRDENARFFFGLVPPVGKKYVYEPFTLTHWDQNRGGGQNRFIGVYPGYEEVIRNLNKFNQGHIALFGYNKDILTDMISKREAEFRGGQLYTKHVNHPGYVYMITEKDDE